METFIYYCKDDAGTETTFCSKACLTPGMRIPADNGTETTIIDMDIETHISVFEDAIDFAIDRMMRR